MSATELSESAVDDNKEIHQDIYDIRSEICDWILVTLSVVAAPALVASLYRLVDFGFNMAMAAQIILASLLWATTFFRQKIPYPYRASFLLSIVFFLAIVGYISFGLVGAGKIWMLVFAIFSAVFFGPKVAVASIIIGAGATALIGSSFVEGIVTLRVDANAYNQSAISWISTSIAYILFGTATAGAIIRLNFAQSKLVTKLHEQSRALRFSQNDLEQRVEQQTQELSLEIIQRKAQAIDLQKSEERFRAFTEASSDRVWETDENFRYTYMSAPSGNLSNPVERLIGLAPWEIEGIFAAPEAWAELRKNIENREPIKNIRFEFSLTRGKKAFGAYFGVPQFDSRNKFIGYRGATQDQTEDEYLRRKAVTIEKRFYDSFAKLNAGFSLWDSSNQLVMCNDFYRATQADLADLLIPGFPFEEFLRARAYSGRPPAAKGREDKWIKESLERFQKSDIAHNFQSGDRWIETRPYRIDDGSTIIFQVDVTEQRKAEAIKSDFVSLVSHELRTPLTSIYGSLKLLGNKTTKIDKETSRELISVAERNSDRLLSLVNDILDLQKIVAGKLELKTKEIELNKIIVESLEENRSFAESYNVKFKFQECEDDLKIVGDTARIKQILANLLSNAAKFSPSGKSVKINLVKNADNAVLSVTDEGPGIAPKHLTEIFDPFVQIADVNTRETGGTGLGLPICKALVAEHNGTIELISIPGKGATFVVTFPLI